MMTLNVCQAGHTFHESKQVDTEYGSWWIWDWERYAGFAGYCTGQDEVSKSIEITGWWEKPDTDRMLSILTEKPGPVLDIGCHIGWFAALALRTGATVLAIDADPENLRLLHRNMGRETAYGVWEGWLKDTPPLRPEVDYLRFLKVDIEGHEREAVAFTRRLWEIRAIDYALLEISPIFENRDAIMAPSYAALVDELIGYGYEATVYKAEGPWVITGADCTFDQENVLFSKL